MISIPMYLMGCVGSAMAGAMAVKWMEYRRESSEEGRREKRFEAMMDQIATPRPIPEPKDWRDMPRAKTGSVIDTLL